MKKAEKQFLSGNERGILSSGFVIASVLAFIATNFGLSTRDYWFLVFVDGGYLLLSVAYVLLLTGKNRSVLLKQLMILTSFLVTGLLVFFFWVLFSFATTFTF